LKIHFFFVLFLVGCNQAAHDPLHDLELEYRKLSAADQALFADGRAFMANGENKNATPYLAAPQSSHYLPVAQGSVADCNSLPSGQNAIWNPDLRKCMAFLSDISQCVLTCMAQGDCRYDDNNIGCRGRFRLVNQCIAKCPGYCDALYACLFGKPEEPGNHELLGN